MGESKKLECEPPLPGEIREAAKDGELVLFIGAVNVSIKSFL